MKRNNINILIASLALFATLTFFTGLIYINNQEKPERYVDNGPILIVDRPTIPKKYIDLPSYNPIKKEIEVEDEKVVVVEKTKDKVKSIAIKPEKLTLSDLSNYKQTLNLVDELDYTENSWQKYFEVIINNVVSNKDSQKTVNEATKQIENAQTLLETKEAYNLRVRKDFAIEDINCYINIDDYTFNGRQALDVINQCSNSIEQAETISLIDETLNSSKAKLDQIMSDQAILARLKDVAKQDLDNYKNSNLYRLNLTTFNELIRDGKNAIDNSLTKEAIDNSLNAAKSKLDSLKTDNQIVAENYRPPAKSELTIAKETALNAIMTYKDEADYTKNLADLQSAISNAKALIDSSTTIELVDAALINAKGIIESILSDENEIELAFKNSIFDEHSFVLKNLPLTINDISIVWKSNNTVVISDGGRVVRDGKDYNVELTATLSLGNKTGSKTFKAKVLAAKWVLPGDNLFIKKTDNSLRYVGNEKHVVIPNDINKEPITSYHKMFYDSAVEGVISLNNNVTDMSSMFLESKATTLDLSGLDTSNVTNMDMMFNNSRVTKLDLSNMNTSNVTSMKSMFAYFGPEKNKDVQELATIIFGGNFDTSKVTDMSTMFAFSKVSKLDLNSFDTSNVTNMNSMFADSHATIILMNNFITPQVTNMANMFKKSMIPDLDLSSFATSKKANITGMFEGMAYEDYKVTNNYKKIYTSSEEQSEKFRQSHVKSNGLKFLLKPAEE